VHFWRGRQPETQQKKKKEIKLSKHEETKIKRMLESKQPLENKNKAKAEPKDLWGEDEEYNPYRVKHITHYPHVPLPHPGQSYNPSKDATVNLLHKVVESNKSKLAITDWKPIPEEQNIFPDSDDEEKPVEDEKDKFKVSNNPAIDDTNRKTRKERKQIEVKKENKLIQREQVRQKSLRIKLSQVKGLKRLLKEREKNQKEVSEKQKQEKYRKKLNEELVKIGVVDDAELLKDFEVNQEPLPLRKMRTANSLVSDRFTNIIKRNVIGEYSRPKVKKRNRKLNKYNYRESGGINNGDDYGYYLEDESNLKIFE